MNTKTEMKESKQYTFIDRVQAIIILLRPHQYYKNVLVFFGIFFSKNLFRVDLWIPMVLAFIGLCLISSLNYLINDFRDMEKDRHHPEKCNRPFPSGRVSLLIGVFIAIILLLLLIISIIIIPNTAEELYLFPDSQEEELLEHAIIIEDSKMAFILVLGALFVTSQFYSLFLKRIVFADVITISVNYVWRAIAGAVLISVSVSPWLIILCFTTAMLLSLAKRKGDMSILGKNAEKHKEVFKMYSPELINQSLATITAIEIVAIFIYLVERHSTETVFIVAALPLITLGIFRYLFLVSSNSIASRKAERIFFDSQIVVVGVIIVILFFFAIYFPNFLDNLLGIPDPKY